MELTTSFFIFSGSNLIGKQTFLPINRNNLFNRPSSRNGLVLNHGLVVMCRKQKLENRSTDK